MMVVVMVALGVRAVAGTLKDTVLATREHSSVTSLPACLTVCPSKQPGRQQCVGCECVCVREGKKGHTRACGGHPARGYCYNHSAMSGHSQGKVKIRWGIILCMTHKHTYRHILYQVYSIIKSHYTDDKILYYTS